MTVQESSKAALRELNTDTIDGQVYAVFAEGRTFKVGNDPTPYRVATRRECAEFLRMQASTVAGAVNRLLKAGWLRIDGTPIKDMYTDKTVQHVVVPV